VLFAHAVFLSLSFNVANMLQGAFRVVGICVEVVFVCINVVQEGIVPAFILPGPTEVFDYA